MSKPPITNVLLRQSNIYLINTDLCYRKECGHLEHYTHSYYDQQSSFVNDAQVVLRLWVFFLWKRNETWNVNHYDCVSSVLTIFMTLSILRDLSDLVKRSLWS